MRLPDYNGGSIVNLMASLQEAMGSSRHAYRQLDLLSSEQISDYRQIVLWVVDGLGMNYLQAHPEARHLNAHLKGSMTSVFPPTTATAVTTFLTGDAPQQHGLTGWHIYFRELGALLAVLPGKARYGGIGLGQAGINTQTLLGHSVFSERIDVESVTLSPKHIAQSDFNLAHLGKSRLLSHSNLTDMADQIVEVLQNKGQRYLYAYWPDLDNIGHQHGIWSEAARKHLLEIDTAFNHLLESCRGTDSLLIICADHGQIDTKPSDRLCLDDHPELIRMLSVPLCGEPRAAYCYLRPGCENAFDDYVKSELTRQADVYPANELIENGWFGLGEPHPRLTQRIGDRLLLMQENYTIKDWLAQERRYELVGVHGGLSEDELFVPLIIAEL